MRIPEFLCFVAQYGEHCQLFPSALNVLLSLTVIGTPVF